MLSGAGTIYRIDLFWFPSFHFTKLKNQNREHHATHVGASDGVYLLVVDNGFNK